MEMCSGTKDNSLDVGGDSGGSLLCLLGLSIVTIPSVLPDDADLDLTLLLHDVTQGHGSSANVNLRVLRSGGPH